jgi:hypothetical protein
VDEQGVPPPGKLRPEVLSSIEQADALVFVVSPDAIASLECRRQLAHAVKRHKRIIPVVHREVDPESVPPELTELSWVSLRSVDAGVETLRHAIDADPDWVRGHTRLGIRALEWDAKDRQPSLLLRAADLRAAEEWLANASGREPAPTSVQAEYVSASRRGRITRRRVVMGVLANVAIVLGALGFVVYERGRPIRNTLRILTDRVDTAKPSQQPIHSALAKIELVLDPSESGQFDPDDVDAHDFGCKGLLAFMRGTQTLLTLSSLECFRAKKDGEIVFWAVVNMDPADSASGKPVHWLGATESVRVSIDLIPMNSRISRGKALVTVNGSVRMEMLISPQVLDGRTAVAAIPNAVLADLSR